MGHKGSWARGEASSYCVRPCRNRDIYCDNCYKFDMFKPYKKIKNDKTHGVWSYTVGS